MLNNQNATTESVIACNFGAIAPADRDAHIGVAEDIFSSSTILEIRELENGYGFRLPLESTMLHQVAEFVANEHRCCPFFTFTMVVEGEAFWLQLTGTKEVKDYISSTFITSLQATGGVSQDLKEHILSTIVEPDN